MNNARAWVISEPKIGTLSQCVAVARHFDPSPTEKTFIPGRGIRKIFDKPLYTRSEAPPDLMISCGFRAEKRVMKAKSAFGMKPLAVHLQKPKIPGYDLVFISRHDWTPDLEQRADCHQMLGVPHRFLPEVWELKRPAARQKYSFDGRDLAVLLVGGANGAYAYDHASLTNIKTSIQELASQGWRVLVSVSRRSSDETQAELAGLNSENVLVWDRRSENPYVDYLAAADAFLIAKDSVTMPCEALSTGRPVYILDLTKIPGPRLDKFERYHQDLQETLRLTRPFAGELLPYSYQVPREAERVAGIVSSALRDRLQL